MKNTKIGLKGMLAAAALALGGSGHGDSLSDRVGIYRKAAAARRQIRYRNTGSGALRAQRTPDQVDLLKFEAHVKRVVRRAKLKENAARRDAGYYRARESVQHCFGNHCFGQA